MPNWNNCLFQFSTPVLAETGGLKAYPDQADIVWNPAGRPVLATKKGSAQACLEYHLGNAQVHEYAIAEGDGPGSNSFSSMNEDRGCPDKKVRNIFDTICGMRLENSGIELGNWVKIQEVSEFLRE